jgi:hypothetical protein
MGSAVQFGYHPPSIGRLRFGNSLEAPGVYASMRLSADSARRLREWAEKNGIPNLLPENTLHVSVFTSEKDCKYRPHSRGLTIPAGHFKVIQIPRAGLIMLEFQSDILEHWREEAEQGGAQLRSKFPFHVTLTYRIPPGFKLPGNIKPPDFDLELEPEELYRTLPKDAATSLMHQGHWPETLKDENGRAGRLNRVA